MKAFLLYQNVDFDLQQALPSHESEITKDLELNTLFDAMATDDSFLYEVAKKVVLTGLNNDLGTIRYRQNILKDCLKNSTIVRNIYSLAVETIETRKKHYWSIIVDPEIWTV